jgi:amidase
MEPQARAQLAGPLSGPLAGVPLLIKDVAQAYAGLPSSQGSGALADLAPEAEHSAVVRRLLGAGAVVFGKINVPELALKGVTDPHHFGRSNNP